MPKRSPKEIEILVFHLTYETYERYAQPDQTALCLYEPLSSTLSRWKVELT